jgi:FKBP-type peptidyl-prolyl cis-trans isomerase 2
VPSPEIPARRFREFGMLGKRENKVTQAKNGDTVKIHYTGKLEDGTTFDSSADRDPLEFTLGKGEIIPGFEQAVVGMEPGESKSVDIPAEKAYGPHQKELVTEIDREKVPPNIDLEAGRQLQLQSPDGRKQVVMVTEVTESSVTLDANHPLAGKDLSFDIKLMEIK